MDRDISEKIISMVVESCAITEHDVGEDTEIKTISLDSLSFVGLIVGLENEFGVEFEDERLNIYGYETVRDIIAVVEDLINAGK